MSRCHIRHVRLKREHGRLSPVTRKSTASQELFLNKKQMNVRELVLPAPSSSRDFEVLCLALYQRTWNDRNAQLNGVSGQPQFGVDIFGKRTDNGALCGVQCKVRAGSAPRLTFSEIEAEVEKAEKFEPYLKHFVIATTARRDATLQTKVRMFSARRQAQGQFSVHVDAWDDLIIILDRHRDIASHFFPFLSAGTQPSTDEEVDNQTVSNKLQENYAGVLSHRFRGAVELLNKGSVYDTISVSRIAEMLGAERISDVSKYFDGQDEPPISFMREFSARFRINPEWLIHGEDGPFYCAEPVAFSPLDALPFLESALPDDIFMVRSKSVYGECVIVAKLDEWKYVTVNGMWHVSSRVGGTGRSQLVDLYDFFLRLLDKKLPCRGFVLEPDIFDQLIRGEIYPGSVLEGYNGNADWWISFLHVDHNSSRTMLYRQWHGQTFLDAQKILRECLSPEMRKNTWNTGQG